MSRNSQSLRTNHSTYKNPFEKNTAKIESTKPVSIKYLI